MFDKTFWATAACLAGFGLAYYLNNFKKDIGNADSKLIAAVYEVAIALSSVQIVPSLSRTS